MRDIVFQDISDADSFNRSVICRRDNAPDVALLVPEGYTSSKLPGRLDGEVLFKRRNAM